MKTYFRASFLAHACVARRWFQRVGGDAAQNESRMSKFGTIKSLLVALLLGGASTYAATIQIVSDNDFALLTGTPTTVTRLVNQNNVVWNTQITNASSFNLTLNAGEDTIYILAMGGGGEENVSGKINNVDIATLSNIRVSSNVRAYLGGYNNTDVADGTYNASLLDVQSALPNLTWSTPTTGSGAVISLSGFALGYPFPDSTAVLYRFSATEVGVVSVPEPSALSLLAVGLGGWAVMRRRRS